MCDFLHYTTAYAIIFAPTSEYYRPSQVIYGRWRKPNSTAAWRCMCTGRAALQCCLTACTECRCAEPPEALKSWNSTEASLAMAAVNAFYNTEERLSELHCSEPFENYCTRGIDFRGKTVGIVGHMHGTDEMRRDAEKIFILEREPRGGDYPDPACDYLLPQCDIVLITGSAITNKTLPHILDLCRSAYTILVGPSVPMCPELFGFGIDRLSGLVITDRYGIRERVQSGAGRLAV